jgi:hypothetical protein
MSGPEGQGLEPVLDPGPVARVGEALRPWADGWPLKIGALVPSTYAAYGRLLHPAFDPEQGEVGWARVAEWSGRELKADSPFDDIATRQDGSRWPGSRPIDGQLERDVCARLARLFRPFTTTPQSAWYCVWGGWGGLAGPEVELAPAIDSRSYRVFRGPLEAITGLVFDIEDPRSVAVLTSEVPSDQEAATDGADLADHLFYSPSLWWPEDRAWFVHTEVDARSTYIGGTEELIRTLLEDPELEILPASLDHTVDGMYRGMSRVHD